MKKKQPIHIIYVPGFGGKYDNFRLWAVKKWRYLGVSAQMVPMKWGEGTFEQKIARLDRAIDAAGGKRVVLLGESAGGSMVIHEYARRGDDLHKVMTLCGKNSHPETVGQRYFDYSPAFRASMGLIDKSIDQLSAKQKAKFVSIVPIHDPVVPVGETLLEGCRRVALPTFGHLYAILAALTIFAPIVIREAKK